MPSWFIALADLVALSICAIAVVTDLRRMRIPNRLTIPAAVLGLVVHLVVGIVCGGGLSWLLAALAGAAIGLLVFGVPAALGLLGMGDVKLAIAIGAWIRWPLALPLALYVALAGGVLALVYMVVRGRSRAVARNLLDPGSRAAHRMPYALAIAMGCAFAIASRYVESLRLIG